MRMRRTVANGLVWLMLAGLGCAGPAVADSWVGVGDVVARAGFTLREEGTRRLVGQSRFSRFVLELYSRRMVFNGIEIYLNASPQKRGGRWVISTADAEGVLTPLVYPSRVLGKVGHRIVVLDPGHGGDDPGAPGPGGTQEKKLALDIAKRVRTRLQKAGVVVYMTRDRDRTTALDERVQRAAKWGADLFVSIHLNSSANRSVSGVETYLYPAAGFPSTCDAENGSARSRRSGAVTANRWDAANLALAHYLHKGLLSCVRAEDRGIRRARYFVIRNTACPSVLVECGFLSNRQEGSRLLTEAGREDIAEGLARGILTYTTRVREAHPAAPVTKLR